MSLQTKMKWLSFLFFKHKNTNKAVWEETKSKTRRHNSTEKSHKNTPGFRHRWILTCTWGWWPTLTGWWQLLLPPNRSEQPMGQQAAESCCRTEPIPGPLAGFPWKPADMQTESEKGWVWEWVNHWPLYTNRAGKSLKSISALDMNHCKSQQLKTKDHLEARKFMAVIHTEWLDLWRVTVQVSTVQSFHVTLLISKPSLHFLFGHGSGQVLALTDDKRQKRRLNLNLFRLHGSGFTYDSCCTSTAITPPGLKRNGTSRFSRLIGNKTGFG